MAVCSPTTTNVIASKSIGDVDGGKTACITAKPMARSLDIVENKVIIPYIEGSSPCAGVFGPFK